MDFQKLDAIAKAYMSRRRSHKEREIGFVYAHGKRTAQSAISLRQRITPDDSHDDILRCAAMFHDVGKGMGEHGATGAEIARFALKDELTPFELGEVCRLIASHNTREPDGDRFDIWARILQDADVLDHFGAMEVWLNFHYCAYHDDDTDKCLEFYQNEFPKECAHVRTLLNFDAARRVYDEKIAFINAFVRRMQIENAGGFVWEEDA